MASAALYQHQPALPGQGSGGTTALAFLSGGGFLGWTLLRRRKNKSLWYVQLGLALTILAASTAVGCGGSSKTTTSTTAPAGTYEVTITGTAGSATQSATFTLTVQ
jgi:hypothetical protein